MVCEAKDTKSYQQNVERRFNYQIAHSSVKCNTVTNVGKKLHREFYSLVFCEVYCLVANSYFEVLGEKPPTKKLTEVN